MQWRRRSQRKSTGGLYHKASKKKKYQIGRDFVPTFVGDIKSSILRTMGGGQKILLLKSNIANVNSNGKIQKAKILSVVENTADSHFVRRNIVTKGAIIQTELGKARVTSRPGQDGIVNAVLIEEKK